MDILKEPSMREYFKLTCLYPKDYTLVHEQDECTKIGIILKGALQMMHYSKEGKDILLGDLKVGDVFGDFLIFSSDPYFPGDIVVTEDTEIAYLLKEEVEHLLETNKAFRYYFLSNVSSKAIKLNFHNKLLNLTTIEDKIIFYIEKEAMRLKHAMIPIKSKASLAKYLNVQRPSLSRSLKLMKNKGILDYSRTHIWLV